jgi:hypothetical protein
MNINELLDKLVSETEIHTAAQNAWGSDGGKARDEARAAVDAEVKRMQDRIAHLEKAIERLGSSEAFHVSGLMDEEARMRITYARAALVND